MLAFHPGSMIGEQCHSLVFQCGQIRIRAFVAASHACFLCLTDNSDKAKEHQYRNNFFHVKAVFSCLHGKVSAFF